MTAGELAFWCVLVVLLRNRAAMDFVGRVISALAVLLLYFLIVAGAARFVAAILTCGLR